MQTEQNISLYKSNSKIRAKIDKLLHKNSTIHSNLGRESTQEEKDEAHLRVKEVAYEIHAICPIFATENFIEVDFKDVL